MVGSLRVCVLACCVVCTPQGLPAAEDATAPASRLFAVHGSYQAYLDYREDEIEGHDFDFDNYLRLHARPFFDDHLSFDFSGRLRADLDDTSVFDEAFDRSNNRVYQGYLGVEDLPRGTRYRLGRQWVPEIDGVLFDGLRADVIDLSGLDLTAFGGSPVSAYSSTDGQDIWGGAAAYRPFRGTTFRVTGVHSDEKDPIANDQISAYWFQRLSPSASFNTDWRILNRRSKDFRFALAGFIPAMKTEITTNYYRRINRSPAPSLDDVEGRRYSEYYLLLGSVQKLDRYGLTATKYFGDVFSFYAGFSLIDIRDREDPANRDTDRYFGGVQFYSLFVDDLNLSVTGNYIRARFDSEVTYTVDYADGSEEVTKAYERDEETFLITGELSYRFSEAFRASVGSAYGDNDFDSSVTQSQGYSQSFLDNDRGYLVSGMGGRFITRTYFAQFWWTIRDDLSAWFLAEYDHSKISANTETGDYARLVTSLTYRF